MRINELITSKQENESFNTSIPVSWKNKGDGNYSGHFEYKDTTYDVFLTKHHYPIEPSFIIYTIDFQVHLSSGPSIQLTKKNQASSILSIVMNQTHEKFIKEKISPDMLVIRISALSQHNTPTEIETRQKLYDIMMDKFGPIMGFNYSMDWFNTSRQVSKVYSRKPLTPDDIDGVKMALQLKP
jgi:hypothetical protein